MTQDSSKSVAGFALSLMARSAPGGGVKTESAGFGSQPDLAEALAPSAEQFVPRTLPSGLSRDEVASVASKVIGGEPLSSRETYLAEAIIIPDLRPAVLVQDNDFTIDHAAWSDYVAGTPEHARLAAALPSVGRIELVNNPGIPYGGTGFVVAPGLVMTNRHVAALFASGVGTRNLRFINQLGAGIDFQREYGMADPGTPIAVREVVMIHPYWDLALLRVEGLEDRAPLRFAAVEPDQNSPRRCAVIGYPAFDPRNPADVQNQVFNGIYNVKRLQPGLLNGRRPIDSFGKTVPAATHDASTLGGNSGSVIIEAASGLALGLHFAGLYRDTNFAVPACDLARDQRMIDAGIEFAPAGTAASGPWDAFWSRVSTEAADTTSPPSTVTSGAGAGGGGSGGGVVVLGAGDANGVRVRVPLEIELTIGVTGVSLGNAAAVASDTATEKMVEPYHDPIDLPRGGYDPDFLGVRVPLPTARHPGDCATLADGSIELTYYHFSVVMNRKRRLALFTASNVDARATAKQPEPGYKYTRAGLSGLGEGDVEKWFTDPRIRGVEQLPDRFFTKDRKAFDKGHLVRREDVAWGNSFSEVRRANGDTYFVTNCSPQTAGFNRSNRRDNWGALEDIVLKQAATERYCVFAGPVLKDSDPDFAGVDDLGAIAIKIPQKYWKIVVAREGESLKSYGFVIAQDLTDVAMEFAVPESWVPHMVRLSDLSAELDSIDFPPEVMAGDQFDAVREASETPALMEAVAAINAMAPIVPLTEAPAIGHGRFEGLPLRVEFDLDAENRRHAHTLGPLSYFTQAGTEWPVPVGSWLDGASIPQAFWSVIGGPFSGLYLEASVVHDYYCDHRVRQWRDVHRMFYEAMLCRGVGSFRAKVMYYAVYRFGPRWDIVEGVAGAAEPAETLSDAKAASIVEDARMIADQDPSLEAIEALAEKSAGTG